MSDDDREQLARRQAELVAALTRGETPPAALDKSRVRLMARTLHRKRARAVTKAWPVLVGALGERFEKLFGEFAGSRALSHGGTDQDGAAFAGFLDGRGLLNDAARLEWVVRRVSSGWPIGLSRMRESDRAVVAVRIPGLGLRMISVPFPRKRMG